MVDADGGLATPADSRAEVSMLEVSLAMLGRLGADVGGEEGEGDEARAPACKVGLEASLWVLDAKISCASWMSSSRVGDSSKAAAAACSSETGGAVPSPFALRRQYLAALANSARADVIRFFCE